MKRASGIYQRCPFSECKDCFARTESGKCDCLSDTDFGGRPCPFYKPESEMPYDMMVEKYKAERDMKF